MKLNRLLTAYVLGLAFLATSSALACEHSSNNSSNEDHHHWSLLDLGWYRNMLSDRGGYSDDNQGKECDNGHGNDSSGCSTKGHTNSGGSTSGSGSGGGSTTAGGGKGIS